MRNTRIRIEIQSILSIRKYHIIIVNINISNKVEPHMNRDWKIWTRIETFDQEYTLRISFT